MTGWAKTPELVYRGGQILADVLPSLDGAPETDDKGRVKDPTTYKTWQDQTAPEFELSDKQFQVCVTATKHFIEQGVLPANKYTRDLLKALLLSGD